MARAKSEPGTPVFSVEERLVAPTVLLEIGRAVAGVGAAGVCAPGRFHAMVFGFGRTALRGWRHRSSTPRRAGVGAKFVKRATVPAEARSLISG